MWSIGGVLLTFRGTWSSNARQSIWNSGQARLFYFFSKKEKSRPGVTGSAKPSPFWCLLGVRIVCLWPLFDLIRSLVGLTQANIFLGIWQYWGSCLETEWPRSKLRWLSLLLRLVYALNCVFGPQNKVHVHLFSFVPDATEWALAIHIVRRWHCTLSTIPDNV